MPSLCNLGPSFKPQSHVEVKCELWVLLVSIVSVLEDILFGKLMERLASAAWVFAETPMLRAFSSKILLNMSEPHTLSGVFSLVWALTHFLISTHCLEKVMDNPDGFCCHCCGLMGDLCTASFHFSTS